MENRRKVRETLEAAFRATYVILVVCLVVSRLFGVIRWPWLIVLSPVWLPVALACVYTAVVVIAEIAKDKLQIKK